MWILGFFIIRGDVISRMCGFSVSVEKITICFVEDVNSWGRAFNEYHEKLSHHEF